MDRLSTLGSTISLQNLACCVASARPRRRSSNTCRLSPLPAAGSHGRSRTVLLVGGTLLASKVPQTSLRRIARLSPVLASASTAQTTVFDEQTLSASELEKWQAAREPLLKLGFAEEDANRFLARSFGWVSSPYWGEEKAKSLPERANVEESLAFLQSLGLSDADLTVLFKKFPEVLGCKVEEEIAKNVKLLEQEWGISGTILKNLLLRNPKVLGYNVDCKGDCMAQCTRCWVRF